MQPFTRERFNAFAATIAQIYGADPSIVGTAAASWFAIEGATRPEHYAAGATPSPQQRLVERMQDTAELLKLINMIGVEQQIGQTIGLVMNGPVASRSNTAGTGISAPQRRTPVDPTGLDTFSYACVPTEFNPLFTYAKLDQWAKFPDFEIRMRDAILRRQALDRIQIGFNGTGNTALSAGLAAGTTDLHDMNKGWVQWMLDNNAERVLTQGSVTNEVTYGGTGADYVNIDALAYDVRMTLLPPWAREDPDLVVIAGSDIIHDKYFPIVNRNEASFDLIAQAALMAGSRTIGYLPAFRVPFMPAGTMIITRFDNLSLYYQTGSMRRMLRDEPQWNRVVDYNSSNEAYVVEDPNFACMVRNITNTATPSTTPALTQESALNTDAPQ
jgi:P2 family phage major capsid protein